MSELLGPDGRPIEKRVLTAQVAAPTVAGVRQVVGPDPSVGLTPQRLANLLRAAEDGQAEEYLALAERMETKDPHYAAVLATRKLAVAQLEIAVEPASESAADRANADLVREWLARDTLNDELTDILDAIGKGLSVCEIVWETSARAWRPRAIEWVDPRWFEIDRADGRTLRLRDGATALDLPPYKFIVHRHKAKSGLPIRGGLACLAAWSYLFKNYAIKDWVAFAEIYGQPLRIGKYPASATPDDRQTLLRAVARIGTDAAAIVPEGMLIEFVKAGTDANAAIYKDLAEFLDRQVSKAVLGQTLTTEVGGGGGSRALGDVHNDVRADLRRADKMQLAATLNRDLVRPLVALNRGPQAAYPRLKLMEPESHDAQQVVSVAAAAAALGLRVSKADVLKKTGLKEAADEADAIGTAPTEPAASRPSKAEASADADPPPRDSIDDLVDEMLAEWEPAMSPLAEPIRRALQESATVEEFRARLPAAIAAMDTSRLEDLLLRGGVAASLAGAAGDRIADADDA